MSYRESYRPGAISGADTNQRITFIRKTYTHLAGAMALFVGLSTVFYQSGLSRSITEMLAGSGYFWLIVLGGFSLIGYLAQSMARADRSLTTQYLGLGIYVVAEALIFCPLIFLAAYRYPDTHILPDAAIVTLGVFAGLTCYVLFSNKDFSFLGGFIAIASFAALAVILVGVLFGFNLGVWFSGAMILLASMAILFSTSKILKYYRADQYVGAALELFAAVALLFWYVLRIFMQLNRR